MSRLSNALRWRTLLHPRQTALTPAWLIREIRQIFGGTIDLDPATTARNPVGARTFVAPPADGAGLPWHGNVFCNPPYGSRGVQRFVDAAIRNAAHGDCRIALLIPAYTETRPFHAAFAAATSTLFFRSRLSFADERGNLRPATHASVLFGFNLDLEPLRDHGALATFAGGEIAPADPVRVCLEMYERDAPKGYIIAGKTRLIVYATSIAARTYALRVVADAPNPTTRETAAVIDAIEARYNRWSLDVTRSTSP